jgi:Leucine-rich repeat (LRR) protein
MLLSIITIGITKIRTMEKNYSEDEIFPNSPPQPSKSGKCVKTFIALISTIVILFSCSSPAVYHKDDKIFLRLFLSQPSAVSGERNGERVGLTGADMSSWGGNEEWISKVNGLTWNDDSPKRLTGIEWNHRLLSGDLDLSLCTGLKSFSCFRNQLTTLNVSGCTGLEELSCRYNQLTSLDVSLNTLLKVLSCSDNRLTSLNVSSCTELETLNCANNKLTFLNLNDNLQLKNINYAGNPLTGNTYYTRDKLALRRFLSQPSAESGKTNGERVGLAKSDMSSWETDEEWVSKVEGLTWNTSSPKRLTGIEWQRRSDYIYLSGTLDLSGCTQLEKLFCWNNQLTTLNVTGCAQLKEFDCSSNQLTTLNVSGCTKLNRLACFRNQLTSLDVSGCTQLEKLSCFRNQLTTLNVSGCTQLEKLSCLRNQLTSLDITGCTKLLDLSCDDNQLTSLDITNCTKLKNLYCTGNQLTSLDITGCTKLEHLSCFNNPLTNYRASGSASPDVVESLASAYRFHASKPQKIAYMDLYNYSKDNELAFDSRYKDRILQVSGVVYSIEKDIMDAYFVRIGNVFGDFVRFYFSSENVNELSDLVKGDEITVQGVCTGRGYAGNYVRLEKCRLLRSR